MNELTISYDIFFKQASVIVNRIYNKLNNSKKTLSIAESITGGLFASVFVSRPGISSFFNESFIAYSNKSKIDTLGINRNTIEKYGAVSKETAEEMVTKCVENSQSDIGISTTGIAGPSGGTKNKKVGLVYCGFSVDKNVLVKKHFFNGNREQIRFQTVLNGLITLEKML
ncbi:MAG: CinA family protein [Candidatus Muiribacteriota bacterium]